MKRSYFNQIAGSWDSIPRPPDAGARVAHFCHRACGTSARRVLDVGSGTGLLAPHLVHLNADTDGIVAVDFALDMLRASRRKGFGGRIGHVCADALRLPFRGGDFDTVLCFGILPHLGDPALAVTELLRVLRPRGVIAVGHLLGSAELNAMHQSIGGPVADDTLLPAAQLAALLKSLGGRQIEAEDSPVGYFVSARMGEE